jgi:hypothetical protein
MKVMLDQLRYPEVTNEEMRASILKYANAAPKLVSQRQICDRVDRLGVKKDFTKFFAPYQIYKRLTAAFI